MASDGVGWGNVEWDGRARGVVWKGTERFVWKFGRVMSGC